MIYRASNERAKVYNKVTGVSRTFIRNSLSIYEFGEYSMIHTI